MYILLECFFAKDRRERIGRELQRLLGQGGMTVFLADSKDVAEISADALRAVLAGNGAETLLDDPNIDLVELIYYGATGEMEGERPIPATHWLSAAKKKADAVTEIWRKGDLIYGALIVVDWGDLAPDPVTGEERGNIFRDDPHLVIRLDESRASIPLSPGSLEKATKTDVGLALPHPEDPPLTTEERDKALAGAAYRIVKATLMQGFKS